VFNPIQGLLRVEALRVGQTWAGNGNFSVWVNASYRFVTSLAQKASAQKDGLSKPGFGECTKLANIHQYQQISPWLPVVRTLSQ
jgi:hypothetical protein